MLAGQKPAWPPGERQAYHAVTLGFYENEILRRIDPKHRSLGQFFQEEIATPLKLDFYIRLPESIPNARLATIAYASVLARLRGFPPRFMLATVNLAQRFALRCAAPSCRTTRRTSTPATSKSLPAAASAPRAGSRALTASSPPAALSCSCAPRRCRPCPHARSPGARLLRRMHARRRPVLGFDTSLQSWPWAERRAACSMP